MKKAFFILVLFFCATDSSVSFAAQAIAPKSAATTTERKRKAEGQPKALEGDEYESDLEDLEQSHNWAQLLENPHVVPESSTRVQVSDFLNAKTKQFQQQLKELAENLGFSRRFESAVDRNYNFENETTQEEMGSESWEVQELVKKACQRMISDDELKATKGKIWDYLNADHAQRICINTMVADRTRNILSIPLLVYALLYCRSTDIIRMLAEKSSVEMRTIALNYPNTLWRIRRNADLHSLPKLRPISVCKCANPDDCPPEFRSWWSSEGLLL